MELFKCLFGVVIVGLVCDVAAQHYWMLPQQKLQYPLSPQPPQQQLMVPPLSLPSDKCLVEENDKLQCGTSDITAEQCEKVNCCFDGRQCYYGKAVTLQCTRDGQFVVVVARDATVPQIDVDTVSLLEANNPACTAVSVTSAYAIFQFPVTACGTTIKEENDFVVYENHMSSSYEVGIGPRGSITRDSHFELLFQCRYSGTAVEALVMEVNGLPPPVPVAAAGPLTLELRLGNGQCHAKGCVEEVAAYSSFYTPEDYPITKVLREPVYVEVRLLERSDPNVVLNLEHCWATSTANPDTLPQWDLLVDGCSYYDDRYMTTIVPVDASSGLHFPSHYKRFIVRMFTFVDPNTFTPQQDMVFLHCTAAVCFPSSADSCEQQCYRKKRAVKKDSSNQRGLVSSREVILKA